MGGPDLNSIMQKFKVRGDYFNFEELGKGLIHKTYLATGDSGGYILQNFNTSIFAEPEKVMENSIRATGYLVSPQYTTVDFLPLRSGDSRLLRTADNTWRVMDYTPGSGTLSSIGKLSHAFEAGSILGRFHYLLSDADAGEFHELLPGFHDLDKRWNEFKSAQRNPIPERLMESGPLIEQFNTTYKFLAAHSATDLRLRVCHNDTKLENILFDLRTGIALGLIDLDTIMPGYFHYDFGDAVRDIAFGVTESGEANTAEFKPEYFKSFLKGIVSSGVVLDEGEKKTLKYGVVLMPFLHGIRALTDYLLGDIYYGKSRGNENYNRAKTLWGIADTAKDHYNEMDRIISGLV